MSASGSEPGEISGPTDADVALREGVRRCRVLADSSLVGICQTDPEGNLVYLNECGAAIVGMSRQQAYGLGWAANLHPGDRDRVLAESLQARTAGTHFGSEYRFRHAGGRVVWVLARFIPDRDAAGRLLGHVGILHDITALKQADEALRHNHKKAEDAVREARDWLELRVRQRTEELTAANAALLREVDERKSVEERLRQIQARYASILNSQQTLVSRSDPQGRITYVNAAHQRTFGSREGDNVFVNVHPDDVESTRRAMEDLPRPPFTCTLEQRCEVRGRWRWFLWQVGAIRDRAGQLVEYQGVGFDITGLKEAEEMLLETTRRARDSAEQARAAAERERLAAEEARQVAEFNRRLALELDHRVRNNLAGLLSLVTAMRSTSRNVSSFAGAIEGRLLSMSNVHQLLADTNWRAVDLRTLVTSLLAAAEHLCPNRIAPIVQGPPVAVSPRQAPPISMILMEWFTNSCKYGAHTASGGGLRVAWETVPPTPAPQSRPGLASRTRLRWTESGGPPPRLPIQPSLGTELVKSFATVELHGSFELGFPEGGADHVLEFPADTVEPLKR